MFSLCFACETVRFDTTADLFESSHSAFASQQFQQTPPGTHSGRQNVY